MVSSGPNPPAAVPKKDNERLRRPAAPVDDPYGPSCTSPSDCAVEVTATATSALAAYATSAGRNPPSVTRSSLSSSSASSSSSSRAPSPAPHAVVANDSNDSIVGSPAAHAAIRYDRRDKQYIIQYEPAHKWWDPPFRAWVFGLNREILALLVCWNVAVVVMARYTNLCGHPPPANTSSNNSGLFCEEDWLMADDAVYNTLGVGMFLLLAFRAHDGYDRFWEGRKAIGRVRECCRDLTRQICFHVTVKVDGASDDAADALLERRRAVGFVGAFASTLKLTLRRERNAVPELGDVLCFQDILNIERARVMPQFCLDVLSHYLVRQHDAGKLGEVTMGVMNSTCLSPMADAMGTCERIRNTPIPLSYALHLRFVLVLWLILYPFHLVSAYGWYAIVLASLVDFAVLGIESMACEVENPFGYHKNCIDLCAFMKGVVADTQEILGRVEHEDRALVFDGDEVRRMNEEMFRGTKAKTMSDEERRELEEMAADRTVCRKESKFWCASY